MSNSGSSRFLVAAVVWLVILGIGVAGYRFFIAPKRQQAVIQESSSDPRFSEQITVSLDSFSGYAVLRSSEFRNELGTHSLGLQLVDDKADYAARLLALKNGDADLAVFTIDALLAACAEAGESPGTIVMILDETIGADAMVAYQTAVPNINALDNPDARIVTTRESPSETLARVVLAHFNLPRLSATPWVDANGAGDVYQKFRTADQKQPYVYVLWEPYVSKALEVKGAHLLIDSSKFRGYIVDVLVARRQYLLEHEDRVKLFMEAYQRASYQYRNKPQGLADLVSRDAQASGEPATAAQAKAMADSIWWKNTQENYAHFGILAPSSSQGLQHIDEMIRNINAVLLKTKAIAADPTGGQPNTWYYDKILRQMHAAQFHPSLISGMGKEETVRNQQALAPLNEAEWNKPTEVGTLEVESLSFARGTSKLTVRSEYVLTTLAKTLADWPQYYLEVRGHSRREGDEEANRLLAEQRAQAAAEFIKSQGVAAARVRSQATPAAGTGGDAQSVSFVLGQKPY